MKHPIRQTPSTRRLFPGALALACLASATAAAAAEFHVSPTGDDANDGSPAAMLQTISEAARRAQPGDVVTVHEGVYRERVNPPRGGESDAMRIVYQAAPGDEVILKGSEVVTGWQHVQNDTWEVTLPNSYFGGFHPYCDPIRGDWFIDNGRDHHTGAVYLDGHWLTEAATLNEVLQPAGGTPLWFAGVDGADNGSLLNVSWFRPLPGPAGGGQIDATGYSSQHGVRIAASSEGGQTLAYIETNDWVRYEDIDFGTNANQIEFRAASDRNGGRIELRLDTRDGELLGTCQVPNTGGWQSWQTITAAITPVSGLRTLCLVFKPASAGADNTTIRAQFKDVDPNTSDVEINVRQSVFYPDKPGIDYLTIRGFTMEHAATPWAPPTAEQIGLIGTHWSKGWIIEDNTIRYSACTGVTLGKYGDEFDNTSQNSATGYVETINRALANGWSGNNIGDHLVRNNTISHCEQAGLVGSLGAVFSKISGNIVRDIHIRRLFSGHEQAGVKIHAAIDTEISGNHIYRTYRGIWLDWMTQGTRVTRNLLHDNNVEQDLYVEVNHGPFLVDHNLFLSPSSLKDVSEGGAYAHNLFAGGIQSAGNSRSTPFHQAHSTALAGSTSIQGGDSRFYNNLFVGTASLAGYNGAVRPMWMDGNVFVHGATASTHEATPITDAAFDPAIHLHPESDGYHLDMELDGAWDDLRTRPLVTTALLGNAAVPNLPYVQPDDSPYSLDTDYLGAARNAANPFPGPFEMPQGGTFSGKVSSTVEPNAGAGASLLSVEPLAGASFEDPAVTDGTQSETMTGWISSSTGSRVMNPDTATFSNQFDGNTCNVPDGSQDFVLFVSGGGTPGWAYQVLHGTTDTNPAIHALTGDEAAGRIIRVTFWAGRGLGVNTYEDQNMRFTAGLQARDIWNWYGRVDYEKLSDGWGDVSLDLSKGQWVQLTADITVPVDLLNGHQPLVLAFGTDSSTADATQIHIDAVTIELLPDPADSDGDGMPDIWEAANGLDPYVDDAGDDDDGDRQSNLAEYLAGTDPQDATSFFHGTITSVDPTGDGITIEWGSSEGRIYQLHQSGDLSTWTPVPGTITATPPTNLETVTPPTGATRFFLRIEARIAK